MDLLQWLQDWFSSVADGGWEHTYCIKIDTLDNPGWGVQIDVYGTPMEGKEFQRIAKFFDDDHWMVCEVEKGKFIGGGDPSKLIEILRVFKEWVENTARNDE